MSSAQDSAPKDTRPPAEPAGSSLFQESHAGQALHNGGAPHHEITAEDVEDHEPHHPQRWWFRAAYVLWFMKNAEFPPLLTTGLNTSPQPGVLGAPGTRVIYGGEVDLRDRHGATFTAGHAFGEEGRIALEASYAFAGDRAVGFATSSAGTSQAFPVLARPFFDVVNNREDASLIAFPQLVGGAVDITYGTNFDTGELNLVYNSAGCHENHVGFLAGFRVCRLEEVLSILEQVSVNPAAPRFAGQNIRVRDLFETDNVFYGGQIGVQGTWHNKRWQLEGFGKLALGVVQRDLHVRGETAITGTPPFAAPAGLLALASNSGITSESDFCVIPEVGLQFGYRLTEHFQLYLGYSFLYWNQVVRPGNEVDRSLNPNLIPTSATFGLPGGPARPLVPSTPTDFWVHSLRFGLEWKF